MPFLYKLFLIGGMLHVYVGLRIPPALLERAAWIWPPAILYLIVSFLLICAAFMRQRGVSGHLADLLAWTGFLAMGIFSFLLVGTFLRDIALLIAWLFNGMTAVAPLWMERSAIWVLAMTAIASLISIYNARRRASTKEITIVAPNLPEAFNGYTIAQISDIHVGPTIKRDYVQSVVAAVNRLHADIIVVTGDVIDGEVQSLRPHTQPLADLSAPDGVYLVTGNHEYYSGAHDWIREFQRLGLNVLLNQHTVIRRGACAMTVAGVTDYSAGAFDPEHRSDPMLAIADAPDTSFKLLLAHQPRSAHAAARAGFHLQLSGHTHGGQFLPWNFFVRLQQPFVAGLQRVGSLQVYISRGTGYWGPPMRLGAPSEITLLHLKTQR
jgi:predicted MPP superfamily phosphohydrolase